MTLLISYNYVHIHRNPENEGAENAYLISKNDRLYLHFEYYYQGLTCGFDIRSPDIQRDYMLKDVLDVSKADLLASLQGDILTLEYFDDSSSSVSTYTIGVKLRTAST